MPHIVVDPEWLRLSAEDAERIALAVSAARLELPPTVDIAAEIQTLGTNLARAAVALRDLADRIEEAEATR